jgi:hypothetical protein
MRKGCSSLVGEGVMRVGKVARKGRGGEERAYRTVKEVAQSVDDWCGYIDCLGFGMDGVYVWL